MPPTSRLAAQGWTCATSCSRVILWGGMPLGKAGSGHANAGAGSRPSRSGRGVVGDTACVGREGGSQRDHRRHTGARDQVRESLFKFLPKLVYSNESRHLVDWSIRGRLLRPHAVRSFHMGARYPGSDLFTDSGLIRPISARYSGGLSLRVWARILVSRFERRSRQRRGGPSGRERRNISMAC